jgi:hypothetical protein
MSTMAPRHAAAFVVTGALLVAPGVSLAATDYSKNSVNGAYTPNVAARVGSTFKDYSKNSVGGDFAPALPSRPVSPARPHATPNGSSFEWGDAAIGAGVALLLSSCGALGGRAVLRRRRTPVPS